MAGIHTMSDKHIAISKAELDGNARPGQIVVDTEDYSLWVGNDDGALIAAGAGGGGGGTPAGPTGALQYVGADGVLAGTDGMVYNPDWSQLVVGPEITNDDGSTSLVGSVAAGHLYAEMSMGSKVVYGNTFIESGAFVEDDGTGTNTSVIDLNIASYFKLSVSGPVNLTISQYGVELPVVSRFTLEIIDGGTNVTWWPGAQWPDGVAPVLSTSGMDIIEFITLNGGASTIGYVKALNVF